MRHGESEWNSSNRFAGRMDITLTQKGEDDAKKVGGYIRQLNIVPDVIFSSTQKRAYLSAEIILQRTGCKSSQSLIRDVRLCERDYGDLTGLNKDEIREKYGHEQVRVWQKSYDIPPPNGESLKDVIENRVRPFYEEKLFPLLQRNEETVIVVAHNNSLRALLLVLDLYKLEEIPNVSFSTASPLMLEYKDGRCISRANLLDKIQVYNGIAQTPSP